MGQAVVIPLPAPVDGLIRLPVCLVGPHRLQIASGHAGRRLLRRNSRRHGPQHRRAAGCQLAAVGNQDLPAQNIRVLPEGKGIFLRNAAADDDLFKGDAVELQTKIRTDGAESALALYTGLTPDHPLFGRILDIYRALAVAAKA